jgi:hypothetical protein
LSWHFTSQSCVMTAHKNDLSGMTTKALLARRRRLAAKLGDVEQVLIGSLAEQARRCGKPGCGCAEGAGHGPYVYFTPKPAGRGRSKYVPSSLLVVVQARLSRGEEVAEVLSGISAINAELLTRRELG